MQMQICGLDVTLCLTGRLSSLDLSLIEFTDSGSNCAQKSGSFICRLIDLWILKLQSPFSSVNKQDKQAELCSGTCLCLGAMLRPSSTDPWGGVVLLSRSQSHRQVDGLTGTMHAAAVLVSLLVLGRPWTSQGFPALADPLYPTQENFDLDRVSGTFSG